MPAEQKPDTDPTQRPQADAPLEPASDDRVLDETARLAREGERELERDPKEPKQRPV